jgi:hypothetical protein
MRNLQFALLAALAGGPAALAQPFAVKQFSLTCGGNTTPIQAGPYKLQAAIGEPLASTPLAGGAYTLGTGFLRVSAGGPAACYANCDGSTNPPILNVLDFICFQGLYAQAHPAANCDGSTNPPILNVLDFICFQSAYATGCP